MGWKYKLAEMKFRQCDWPLIWKLLVRILDPSAIRQEQSAKECAVTVQAWLTGQELDELVRSLDHAGIKYEIRKFGEDLTWV